MTVVTGDGKNRIAADKLRPADLAGRRQFQPMSEDWVAMNPEVFSYNADNILNISTIDPTEYFQVGDRLRMKQTGDSTYRYFYITRSDTTLIKVFAGLDYIYANLDILEIAISRHPNPIGFPPEFEFALNPTFTGGGSPIIASSVNHTFRMLGELVFLDVAVEVTYTLSSPPTAFDLDYPFQIDADYFQPRYFTGANNAHATLTYGLVRIITLDQTKLSIDPNTWGGTGTEFFFTATYPAKQS